MEMHKAIEALHHLESQPGFVDCFSWKNTNAWIHVKFRLYKNLVELKERNAALTQNKGFISLLFSALMSLFVKRKAEVLFFGSSRGPARDQSHTYDRYFPSREITLSETKIFYSVNRLAEYHEFREFYKHHGVVCENILVFSFAKVLSFFFRHSVSLKSCVSMQEKFEDCGLPFSSDRLRNDYLDFVVKYEIWRFLLKLYPKARKAYLISSYSKSFVVAALKSRNIEVVELQHGVAGRFGVGYDFHCDTRTLPFPDGLYVYNQLWKDEFVKCNFVKNISIYEDPKFERMSGYVSTIPYRYVVFTGQGMKTKEISDVILNDIPWLKKNELKIIYKPHPSEFGKYPYVTDLAERFPDEVVYYEGPLSAEKLIKGAVAHLSYYSACHFDAVHLLGKTYMLYFENETNLLDFFHRQYPGHFHAIGRLSDIQPASDGEKE